METMTLTTANKNNALTTIYSVYCQQPGNHPFVCREAIPLSCCRLVLKEIADQHQRSGWIVTRGQDCVEVKSTNPLQGGAKWFIHYEQRSIYPKKVAR